MNINQTNVFVNCTQVSYSSVNSKWIGTLITLVRDIRSKSLKILPFRMNAREQNVLSLARSVITFTLCACPTRHASSQNLQYKRIVLLRRLITQHKCEAARCFAISWNTNKQVLPYCREQLTTENGSLWDAEVERRNWKWSTESGNIKCVFKWTETTPSTGMRKRRTFYMGCVHKLLREPWSRDDEVARTR